MKTLMMCNKGHRSVRSGFRTSWMFCPDCEHSETRQSNEEWYLKLGQEEIQKRLKTIVDNCPDGDTRGRIETLLNEFIER